MDDPVQPEVYVPLAEEVQNPLTFVIRSRLEPDAVISLARAQVRAVDKDLVPTDVTTLEAWCANRSTASGSGRGCSAASPASRCFSPPWAYTACWPISSRSACASSASGSRSARRHAQVWRMVVRQGMRPVLWGSIAGLAAAYAAAELMKSLLFGVAPLDPATYATTVAAAGADRRDRVRRAGISSGRGSIRWWH